VAIDVRVQRWRCCRGARDFAAHALPRHRNAHAQGAQIDGEPGVGYVLRPGFMLPPLMFSKTKIEAIVLGSHWVADRTDAALSDAARSALAKISAVLPPDLKAGLDTSGLLIGPGKAIATAMPNCRHSPGDPDRSASCGSAISRHGRSSRRPIWPFALAFSTACALSWRGASYAKAFGISRPPTASARCKSSTGAIRARRQALLKDWVRPRHPPNAEFRF